MTTALAPQTETHRPTVDLTGTWQFWPDLDDTTTELSAEFVSADARTGSMGAARSIEVPCAWQAAFEDLRLWSGTAWYERDVDVPAEWQNGRIRLHFAAVDYLASVWVDGQHVADHEGGYLPFHVDVTDVVTPGETATVSVRVHDPRGHWPADVENPFIHSEVEDQFVPFHEIPHGKQSWYGPLSGIWQRVWLEQSNPVWTRHTLLRGDVASSTVHAIVRLGAPATGSERARITITAPDGSRAAQLVSEPLTPGSDEATFAVALDGAPQLWAPEHPHLYSAMVELISEDDEALDTWSDTFGFRTVSAVDGQIHLNGEPVYVRGALDQDYYAGTITTTPSEELLDEQIRLAKELGLNLLRHHIKAPDPRYLYAADRAGMLIWQEAPNWISFNPKSTERGMATLRGMIERDFNHPSTIIWTIMNESWGIDIAGNAEHREWLLRTFDEIKALDPSRLVTDNSPCEPSFHVKTDLNDFHFYKAIPEHADEWSAWTRNFAEHPEYGFSKEGDAVRTGREPIIVSEFGNWGLPDADALAAATEDGRDPWWFDTGSCWNSTEAVHPLGVRERFAMWNLERVFGSWDGFIRSSQEHEYEALKFEIEDMRSHQAIAGYVITEFTDVHWESNGLLDMNRGTKAFHDRFHLVNGDDVLAVVPEARRVRAGDTLRANVRASSWSGRAAAGSEVRWSIPAWNVSGAFAAEVDRTAVRDLGTIEAAVPAEIATGQRVVIELTWVDPDGEQLTRSELTVLAFPASTPTAFEDVRVSDSWLDVHEHVAAGGRAVVALDVEQPVPAGLEYLRVERGSHKTEDAFHADWAQGLSFIGPELRDGLPLVERVDMPFVGMTPWGALGGVDAADNEDVLAGNYVGWMHALGAVALAVRHGDGAAILTTFDLLQHGGDPLAEALLERMRAIVASEDFAPRTVLA